MARQFHIGQVPLGTTGKMEYFLFEKTPEKGLTMHLTKTFGGSGTLSETARELLRVRKAETKKDRSFAKTALTLSSIPQSIFSVDTDSNLHPIIKPVEDSILEAFREVYLKVGGY